MSAVLKRITVEKEGVVEIHDPELQVGQVIWVSVEKDADRPSREELAREFTALAERTQASARAAGITDEDIAEAIEEVRREKS